MKGCFISRRSDRYVVTLYAVSTCQVSPRRGAYILLRSGYFWSRHRHVLRRQSTRFTPLPHRCIT